jgi:ABC-type transporter Mla subunit MlaD
MTKPKDKTKTTDPQNPLRTLEELKTDATSQLKKILAQGKTIKNFKSNMDLIIKRYHTNDSFIDNLASSYGDLQWWVKLGMLASVVSIGACIGIACNLVIVLAVVTFVLYSSLALILESHHSAMLKRDKKLAEDIVELEESLAESVQHINEIEESLESVLTSLCEMNLQQAEDIEVFEAQISELEEHINKLTEINGKLDSTKDVLVDSTQQIGEIFEKAKVSLTELTDSLMRNAEQLDSTDQELLKGTTALLLDQDHLKQISASFDENHSALSSMTEDLVGLLDTLKIQSAATEAFNEEALEKLSQSINKTLTTTLDTDQVVSQADSTVDDAVKLLDEYKASKSKVGANGTKIAADFKERAKTANAALERAASILASQYRPRPSGFLESYAPLLL